MKSILMTVVALALVGGGGFYYWKYQSQPSTTFMLADVKRGKLEATVGSTGTLQPREIVDIGAQVQGRITMIGADPTTQSKIVDWGSEVLGPEFDKNGNITKQGTLLAQIDPLLYQAMVDSADAAVASAIASVKSAEAAIDVAKADLLQKNATLVQATADWTRTGGLIKTGGISQAEFDQYNATHEVALANVKSSTASIEAAEAKLKSAKASVKAAQAQLDSARTNLDYTKITAPVNGVVVDRRVNVGQTVVASLSAPSLFLIAKDLSKTEVWATVNEVDVGKIKIDTDENAKNVSFTVDAYPGRVYHGRVVPQGKLPFRLNAQNIQNVVTYTVVVSVDDKENADGMLRPYMTTNLTFTVGEREHALMVPNSALRWQPAKNQIAPDVREAYYKMRNKKRSPNEVEPQDRGVVWIKGDDNLVRFIEVKTGLGDSVNTEIVQSVAGGELTENSQVIIGESRGDFKGSGTTNPFIASPFSAKKKAEGN
jgi:HlyD family secretion protein